MSKALIEKLLRSRESRVTAGGKNFTIRRPTDADALDMRDRGPLDFVKKFVVGWDLTELDVVPGGSGEAVQFTADLWAAWIVDHPDYWEPLANAIVAAYGTHAAAKETTEKN